MPSKFDYDSIPIGFYDDIFRHGTPIRRAWHVQKFHRIRDCLPSEPGNSIIDIGCFSGTFLSTITESAFPKQVGVDIIEAQIRYATENYGTKYREFVYCKDINELGKINTAFDVVTLIEVIEHLEKEQINELIGCVSMLLKPGGRLVLSTPNYCSIWPLLELYLNHISDVSYEEQHITKFTYFNFHNYLKRLYPRLDEEFYIDIKTTTHFITPFLAGISFTLAEKLSALYPHNRWKLPLGCLLLAVLIKK